MLAVGQPIFGHERNFSRKQKSIIRVPLAVHLLKSQKVSDRYQQSLKQYSFQLRYNKEELVEEWQELKECIMTSADACARKKQPTEWFIDAADILNPLLDDKNRACQKYMQLQRVSAKHEF